MGTAAAGGIGAALRGGSPVLDFPFPNQSAPVCWRGSPRGVRMYWLLLILHIAVCFVLIVVVLLQSGKGADLAGAFGGGGSQTALGARGTATFLSKLTTGAAIVFMLT